MPQSEKWRGHWPPCPRFGRLCSAALVTDGIGVFLCICLVANTPIYQLNGWQLAKMKKSIPDMSLP